MCVGILSLSLASVKQFTGEPLKVQAKEKIEQTKHTNYTTHREFVQLEKSLMLGLVSMLLIPVQIKQSLIDLMNGLPTHQPSRLWLQEPCSSKTQSTNLIR